MAGQRSDPTIVFAPGTTRWRRLRPLGRTTCSARLPTTQPAMNFNYSTRSMPRRPPWASVIAADLIDLGTPGQHTYVNHTEEGQAVLDAARAAWSSSVRRPTRRSASTATPRVVGTAGAADHAATYAPELNVKGTFAGAPPADLLEVVKAVDNHMIAGVAG